MANLMLAVLSADGAVRFVTDGGGEATMSWRGAYEPGDRIVVRCDEDPVHLVMRLDVCLAESRVLLRGGYFEFAIPFGDARKAYGKGWAFADERHWAYVRVEEPREAVAWRNLALNAHDLGAPRELTRVFPHATTNVSCDNPQFFARNVIDGVFEAAGHGSWPHESWSVCGRDDAWLKVDFGEPVAADELRLYLRADYPHDTWWSRLLVEASDGAQMPASLGKTGRRQTIDLGGRSIEWLRVSGFERAEERGFPGLSQLEVWGRRA